MADQAATFLKFIVTKRELLAMRGCPETPTPLMTAMSGVGLFIGSRYHGSKRFTVIAAGLANLNPVGRSRVGVRLHLIRSNVLRSDILRMNAGRSDLA